MFVLVLLGLGLEVVFLNGCVMLLLDNVYFGSGYLLNGFMVLDTVNVEFNNNSSVYVANANDDALDNNILWHARLGHIGQDCMKRLAKEGLLSGLAKIDMPVCEHCLADKAKRASIPLQLVHSDIYSVWLCLFGLPQIRSNRLLYKIF